MRLTNTFQYLIYYCQISVAAEASWDLLEQTMRLCFEDSEPHAFVTTATNMSQYLIYYCQKSVAAEASWDLLEQTMRLCFEDSESMQTTSPTPSLLLLQTCLNT